MMRNIRKRLDAIGLKADAGTANWTAAIKTELCSLGGEFDFWVYASGCEVADGGEYLYDVTWLDYEGDLLTSAALVVECEWKNLDHIDEDFQKLLFPRADIRLMIFDGSTYQPYTHDIMEHLAKQIRHFQHSSDSDSWLFAAWESDEESARGWRFRWYTVRRGEPLLLQS